MAATHQQQPTIDEAWEKIAEREDLSQFDTFERVQDAAADSETLFEAAQKARMRRKSLARVFTWFGIADPTCGGRTVQFPPEDVIDRLRMLDEGHFPTGARAVEQWGGPDE